MTLAQVVAAMLVLSVFSSPVLADNPPRVIPAAAAPAADEDGMPSAEAVMRNLVVRKSQTILDGKPYSGRIRQRLTRNGQASMVSMIFSGDFSRMEMTGPDGRQIIIVNEDGYFVYTPHERQAIQLMKADDEASLRRFGRLNALGTLAAVDFLDVHQFQYLRDENYNGHMCAVYEVEGAKDGLGTMTYWIAAGFRYPLKVEQTGAEGTRVIEFLEFEPNVHVSMDEFRIPDKVTVVNLAGESLEE